MRYKVVAHPDSLEAIKRKLGRELGRSIYWVDFVSCESTPKSRKTGRVIWPDGSIGLPEDGFDTRFVRYGAEDVPWMIALGAASYEEEPVAFLMEDRLMLRVFTSERFGVPHVPASQLIRSIL